MFDAHAHLQDMRLRSTQGAWVEAAARAQITGVCSCGTRPEDWPETAAVAQQPLPFIIVPGFGVHPWYVEGLAVDWQEQLEQFFDQHPTAVVGEIGLDGIRDGIPAELQASVLRWQLDFAARLHRPVVLHGARAWGRLVELLKPYAHLIPSFVAHSFGGSADILKELLKMGGYVSFAGTVCNTNATKVRLAAKETPASQILVETDAPDLFPLGGTSIGNDEDNKPVNHPANLPLILNEIAALRGMPPEELSDITGANARRLFHFSLPSKSAKKYTSPLTA
jgi:TatD DNase family protein